MVDHHSELDAALNEVAAARRIVDRIRAPQVRNAEARDFLKATALSWFRKRRGVIAGSVPGDVVERIDQPFRTILESADKAAARSTYVSALKEAKAALAVARGVSLVPPATGGSDSAPDFSPLAADPEMRTILSRRWDECQRCLGASASLAATVMMGGLLEALFVARANRLSDKSALFKCATTPIDSKTKKPLELKQWTLAPYIDVGHELGWISRSAKDVALILRDYRNYVHPEKERSHGVTLNVDDARMFWDLTKSLSRQLLALTGKV
jgi:hypothetical protein